LDHRRCGRLQWRCDMPVGQVPRCFVLACAVLCCVAWRGVAWRGVQCCVLWVLGGVCNVGLCGFEFLVGPDVSGVARYDSRSNYPGDVSLSVFPWMRISIEIFKTITRPPRFPVDGDHCLPGALAGLMFGQDVRVLLFFSRHLRSCSSPFRRPDRSVQAQDLF
jgi:hypothetical protein